MSFIESSFGYIYVHASDTRLFQAVCDYRHELQFQPDSIKRVSLGPLGPGDFLRVKFIAMHKHRFEFQVPWLFPSGEEGNIPEGSSLLVDLTETLRDTGQLNSSLARIVWVEGMPQYQQVDDKVDYLEQAVGVASWNILVGPVFFDDWSDPGLSALRFWVNRLLIEYPESPSWPLQPWNFFEEIDAPFSRLCQALDQYTNQEIRDQYENIWTTYSEDEIYEGNYDLIPNVTDILDQTSDVYPRFDWESLIKQTFPRTHRQLLDKQWVLRQMGLPDNTTDEYYEYFPSWRVPLLRAGLE